MARTTRIDKRKAEGGRQISALLNKEEADLLARHEGALGGVKAALVAGLKALDRGDNFRPTKAELLAEIGRRLK
jgi:hypothetical protein